MVGGFGEEKERKKKGIDLEKMGRDGVDCLTHPFWPGWGLAGGRLGGRLGGKLAGRQARKQAGYSTAQKGIA